MPAKKAGKSAGTLWLISKTRLKFDPTMRKQADAFFGKTVAKNLCHGGRGTAREHPSGMAAIAHFHPAKRLSCADR
jgi:hypothetical protein